MLKVGRHFKIMKRRNAKQLAKGVLRPASIYVDSKQGSQPLDLRSHYYYNSLALLPRKLLPTSDSRAPLISTLLSHKSKKGLRAFRTVLSYSLCA